MKWYDSHHEIGKSFGQNFHIQKKSLLINLFLLLDHRMLKNVCHVPTVHIRFVGLDNNELDIFQSFFHESPLPFDLQVKTT
jgi:hypothetical protein